MKKIYMVNVQMTGCNGGIIRFTESAYLSEDKANEVCNAMHDRYENDPNYMAYVSGPIILYEN